MYLKHIPDMLRENTEQSIRVEGESMSTLLDVIKRYRLKSIFFYYFKMLFIIIIVLMIIYSTVFYAFYKSNIRANMVSFSSETLTTVGSTADNIISEATQYSRRLLLNDYALLFAKSQDVYLTGSLFRRNTRTLLENINEFVNYSDYIMNIWICSFESNYVLTNLNCGKLDDFKDTEWLGFYNDTKKDYFIIPGEDKETIFVGRYMPETGLVVVQLNTKKLADDVKKNKYVSSITISNENDVICYSSKKDNYSTLCEMFTDEFSYNSLLAVRQNYTEIYKDSVTAAMISDLGLVYTIEVDAKNVIKEQFSDLPLLFGALTAGILILGFFLAVLITVRIYRTIADIGIVLQSSGSKKYLKSKNEVTFIYENINSIYEMHRKNEAELEKRKRMLDRATNVALQAQIAPHFLFNTMQAIASCVEAELSEDNEAVKLVLLFGDLLHITFDTKENIIPLQKEIEHAEKYLEIQRLKYGGIHTIVWDTEESTKRCNILKLVLQPVIENAIEHGFDGGEPDDGILRQITIRIFSREKKLYVKIIDNGVGMSNEQLQKIRKNLDSEYIPESKNIGLANVNLRVKLAFGEEYGVSIESVEGKGTEVTIVMPEIIEE